MARNGYDPKASAKEDVRSALAPASSTESGHTGEVRTVLEKVGAGQTIPREEWSRLAGTDRLAEDIIRYEAWFRHFVAHPPQSV